MRKLAVTELNRLTAEAYKICQKTPIVIILDHVRSLHNVGSIFRTADAFRIEGVYLCGITATPPHVEIHKTALGAEDTVHWRYYTETLEAVNDLKQQGYVICGIEQTEGSASLEKFSLDQTKKYALVIGHEVKGVQQHVIDACDRCIEIPQFGTKHSLNVSVAAGIVIWDFFKVISDCVRPFGPHVQSGHLSP